MGLMDAQDELGREVQHKRAEAQAEAKAKEEGMKEQEQKQKDEKRMDNEGVIKF